MRFVVSSVGTLGDIVPFVRLGVALCRRGHSVTLAAPANFATICVGTGIEFAGLPDSGPAELRRTIAHLRTLGLSGQLQSIANRLSARLSDDYDALLPLCRDADALISSSYQMAGRMAAEVSSVPYVSVHLGPFVGATPEASREPARSAVNLHRQRCGLPPLSDPMGEDAISTQLAIHAVTRRIYSEANLKTSRCHVTGFFLAHDGNSLSSTLEAFMMREEQKPVVVTFGSMLQTDNMQFVELVSQCMEAASLRGVVQLAWNDEDHEVCSRHFDSERLMCATGWEPHASMFSLSAAVVHHGGAGTTASVLAAGIPTVTVPHVLDQQYWAHRLREWRCSPGLVLPSRLTAERLSGLIKQALADRSIARAVLEARSSTRKEAGVAGAVSLIESLLGDGNLPGHTSNLAKPGEHSGRC